MGQLIVRGLDDDLIQALKRRAARTGRPAEAEHRAILEHAARSIHRHQSAVDHGQIHSLFCDCIWRMDERKKPAEQ